MEIPKNPTLKGDPFADLDDKNSVKEKTTPAVRRKKAPEMRRKKVPEMRRKTALAMRRKIAPAVVLMIRHNCFS